MAGAGRTSYDHEMLSSGGEGIQTAASSFLSSIVCMLTQRPGGGPNRSAPGASEDVFLMPWGVAATSGEVSLLGLKMSAMPCRKLTGGESASPEDALGAAEAASLMPCAGSCRAPAYRCSSFLQSRNENATEERNGIAGRDAGV